MSGRTSQRGVTYLALLLAIALASGVLAAGASVWSQVQRREREKQLLWAGDQFRRAIAAYAQSGAVAGTYPRRLEDLLEDSRSPAARRFIRQIYDDPFTRGSDWGLIRDAQGGITGVYSRYKGVPIKTGQFPAQYRNFERAKTYADWKFAVVLPPRAEEQPGAQSGAGAGGGDAAPRSVADAPPSAAGKPASGGEAAPSSGAPAQPAVTKNAAPQPGIFVPSPLTPLQSLQSPFAPRAMPGTPAAAPPAPSTAPRPAAPSGTQTPAAPSGTPAATRTPATPEAPPAASTATAPTALPAAPVAADPASEAPPAPAPANVEPAAEAPAPPPEDTASDSISTEREQ